MDAFKTILNKKIGPQTKKFTPMWHICLLVNGWVVVSQKDEGGIIAPAITVFPWSTENLGLKINIPENLDPYDIYDMYESSGRQGTVEEWLQKISYNYS